MLTLFPIQWLALLAYFILRVLVGGVVLTLGLHHLRIWPTLVSKTKVPFFPFPRIAMGLLIATEIIIAFLLVPGIYTQIGALLLIALSIKILFWRGRLGGDLLPARHTYVLLLACGLSLFITGAGALAIDLPI